MLPDWLDTSGDIVPYVFMRRDNHFTNPGTLHKTDWFPQKTLVKYPLDMDEVWFANRILHLESGAFDATGMPMPRWVFYDCAILPGVVCGFAKRVSKLTAKQREILEPNDDYEYCPISLFIMIPTIRPGEWVAHNLTSLNALVKEKEDKHYALGFLSKCFGLWYANVEILGGVFQWKSPAIKLHSHFGAFEILTSYTPVHNYPRTMTYRSIVNTTYWETFFDKKEHADLNLYQPAGFNVDPENDESLISLQRRIESGEGPYYLRPDEIRQQKLGKPLHVWTMTCHNS